MNENNIAPASLWKRIIEQKLDSIFLYILLAMPLLKDIYKQEDTLLIIFQNVITFLYFFLMIGFGKWHTTLGGRIMNIYVVNKNGEEISYIKSFLRAFIETLIGITIYFFIFKTEFYTNLQPTQKGMVGLIVWLILISPYFFTKDKLLLLDYLSGTKMVRNIEDSKKPMSVDRVIFIILAIIFFAIKINAYKLFMLTFF
jgi:uncharacterized RDD family membrane protein YckC